jgi:hypothetical protein
MEKYLVGKFFAFAYASGTAFRAGRIEPILTDGQFLVRYLRNGKLEKFTHVVRHYNAPSVENLTGYLLCNSQEDLMQVYEDFLKHFILDQKDRLAAAAKTSEVSNEAD